MHGDVMPEHGIGWRTTISRERKGEEGEGRRGVSCEHKQLGGSQAEDVRVVNGGEKGEGGTDPRGSGERIMRDAEKEDTKEDTKEDGSRRTEGGRGSLGKNRCGHLHRCSFPA